MILYKVESFVIKASVATLVNSGALRDVKSSNLHISLKPISLALCRRMNRSKVTSMCDLWVAVYLVKACPNGVNLNGPSFFSLVMKP